LSSLAPLRPATCVEINALEKIVDVGVSRDEQTRGKSIRDVGGRRAKRAAHVRVGGGGRRRIRR